MSCLLSVGFRNRDDSRWGQALKAVLLGPKKRTCVRAVLVLTATGYRAGNSVRQRTEGVYEGAGRIDIDLATRGHGPTDVRVALARAIKCHHTGARCHGALLSGGDDRLLLQLP